MRRCVVQIFASNGRQGKITNISALYACVEDAKKEADRRIVEGEKSCRISYDKTYAAELGELENAYNREISAIKEEYKKQLEMYKAKLDSYPMDKAAFSALAERLFNEKVEDARNR